MRDIPLIDLAATAKLASNVEQARRDFGFMYVAGHGDALTVNIGDMMELWSRRSGAERCSFPYFVVPGFDTVVEPMRSPLPGFSRRGLQVGEVSPAVWRTNRPDTLSAKPHFDLGTLEN